MKTFPGSRLAHQGQHALLNYSTPRKLRNLARSLVERKLRRSRVTAWPYRLIVDVTNSCNLRCSHCPTGKQVKGRPRGFMDLARFGRILDELGDFAYIIDLFNWGESLLHKDIVQMISMAEQRKVCTSIHTNLNVRLSDVKLEGLLQSGLTYLSVSLDGADQETYGQYRKGGSLDTALDNAARLISFRKRLGRRKPFLTWQYLIFPHNAHQVERAHGLSQDIGFDRFVTMPGITDRNRPVDDRRGGICDWLWTTATFHWDGGIGPCCLQFMDRDDFGVFGDDDFMSVWNNEKFQDARSLFSGNPRSRQKIMCNQCYKVKAFGDASR